MPFQFPRAKKGLGGYGKQVIASGPDKRDELNGFRPFSQVDIGPVSGVWCRRFHAYPDGMSHDILHSAIFQKIDRKAK